MDNEMGPEREEFDALRWWNTLTNEGHTFWMAVAKGSVAKPTPLDAWQAYKRVEARKPKPPE